MSRGGRAAVVPIEHRLDELYGLDGRDVLPDSQDGPVVGYESCVGASVALDVLLQLGYPVLGIRLWLSAMLGAAMPEATVAIDGKLRACEDDVRSIAPAFRSDGMIDPEAPSSLVERRT